MVHSGVFFGTSFPQVHEDDESRQSTIVDKSTCHGDVGQHATLAFFSFLERFKGFHNDFSAREVDIDALHPVGDVQWTRSAGRMVQGAAGHILVDSVDNGSRRRPRGPKLNRGNHLILNF